MLKKTEYAGKGAVRTLTENTWSKDDMAKVYTEVMPRFATLKKVNFYASTNLSADGWDQWYGVIEWVDWVSWRRT